MPCSPVSSLLDLGLKNMAVNVVRHSSHFNEMQPNSKFYVPYRIIQNLFSDEIQEMIKHAYVAKEEVTFADHFRLLTHFLFQGQMSESFTHYSSCLKFLFGEYTTTASLQFPEVKGVTTLFLDALLCCKNLRRLTLQSCCFSLDQLLQLPCWSSLIELDLLLSSCSSFILMHVFSNCPSIKILRASGEDIKDDCLLYLCTKQNEPHFDLCPADGFCCDMGKKLVELTLYGTSITISGIACALQHLHQLRKFLEGHLRQNDLDRHFLIKGMRLLKRACKLQSRRYPIFKLTTLIYDEYSISTIPQTPLCYCPELDTVIICRENNDNLDSFFANQGHTKKSFYKKIPREKRKNFEVIYTSTSALYRPLENFIAGPQFYIPD